MPPLRDVLPVLRGRPIDFPKGASRFQALIDLAVFGGRGDPAASALDEAGLLDPAELAAAPLAEVADVLRDARVEADPRLVRLLQRLAGWYASHREDLEHEPGPGETQPPFPRDELAAINGVGRATADGIALHVFGQASYPVDRATYRILVRHGWIDVTAEYDDAAQALISAAEGDPADLARMSSDFADVGRRFCKPSAPRCEPCPLRVVLPDGGPIAVDG
ncbi:endonuclease III [Paludisphaera rhizosphaerae]|uniref:endonuclease III n=1 Tax=Paludisphaera rhizosphaerae TaxID=2711216 RepID=UPI0013EE1145|nr:endonuclease III [Paludisphaera rhizosphaerae]